MKKRLLLMTIVLLVSVFVLGCSNDTATEGDQSLESIKDRGTFIVGLDDGFAPMGFRDEGGEIVGFDVDMAKEAIERLGVDVEFQPIDWASKELSLNKGDIDCIWNGLTITPEREKEILFSKPYLANDQIIIVLADSNITTKADLNGKIVGLQAGSSSFDALNKEPEIVEALKDITEYEDNTMVLSDLGIGRIDVMVVDEVLGRYYIAKKPGEFRVLEENFGSEEYGIGFRMEDVALRNEINEIMDEMKKDGAAAAISEEWFGEDIVLK